MRACRRRAAWPLCRVGAWSLLHGGWEATGVISGAITGVTGWLPPSFLYCARANRRPVLTPTLTQMCSGVSPEGTAATLMLTPFMAVRMRSSCSLPTRQAACSGARPVARSTRSAMHELGSLGACVAINEDRR